MLFSLSPLSLILLLISNPVHTSAPFRRGGEKKTLFVRRCSGSLCFYSLGFPPIFLFHLSISTFPLSLLINEYTTFDTKNLTSNELGNPFSHFWLPIPKLCVCFSLCVFRGGEQKCDSQTQSCLCSSALWPLVPGLPVPLGDC